MNKETNVPLLILLCAILVICSAWLGATWVEVKQINRYLDSIKNYTMDIRYDCKH